MIQLVQDGGNGDYHALSLKATRRFGEGLSVVSSYTFAKSIDDTSGIRTQGFDTLSRKTATASVASAAFRLSTSAIAPSLDPLRLPFGKGKRINIGTPCWTRGGRLADRRHHHDADRHPRHVGIGGVDNAATSDGGYDRPNSTGVSVFAPNRTPSRWLNPAAFTEAPPAISAGRPRHHRRPGHFQVRHGST